MKLVVIIFKDDEGYISHCPALNLCGCGDTEQEAWESFEIVFDEYQRYTEEENTLEADLLHYGWKITKEDGEVVINKPEGNITSRGKTVEDAVKKLRENLILISTEKGKNGLVRPIFSKNPRQLNSGKELYEYLNEKIKVKDIRKDMGEAHKYVEQFLKSLEGERNEEKKRYDNSKNLPNGKQFKEYLENKFKGYEI
jgi:predicted RNase H-like HicB family nuclease